MIDNPFVETNDKIKKGIYVAIIQSLDAVAESLEFMIEGKNEVDSPHVSYLNVLRSIDYLKVVSKQLKIHIGEIENDEVPSET